MKPDGWVILALIVVAFVGDWWSRHAHAIASIASILRRHDDDLEG